MTKVAAWFPLWVTLRPVGFRGLAPDRGSQDSGPMALRRPVTDPNFRESPRSCLAAQGALQNILGRGTLLNEPRS